MLVIVVAGITGNSFTATIRNRRGANQNQFIVSKPNGSISPRVFQKHLTLWKLIKRLQERQAGLKFLFLLLPSEKREVCVCYYEVLRVLEGSHHLYVAMGFKVTKTQKANF